MCLYGCVLDIAPVLGEVTGVKRSLRISSMKFTRPVRRMPISASLGPHLVGVACPRPDLSDPANVILGVCKRYGGETPRTDRGLMREF